MRSLKQEQPIYFTRGGTPCIRVRSFTAENNHNYCVMQMGNLIRSGLSWHPQRFDTVREENLRKNKEKF